MLRGIDHRGAGVGVHQKGWNADWERWIANKMDDGIEITKEMVDKRLADMICEYDLPNKGFAAKHSYRLRSLAYAAAHQMWMQADLLIARHCPRRSDAPETGESLKIRIPKSPFKGLGGPAGFIIVVFGNAALGSQDPVGEGLDGLFMTTTMGDSDFLPSIEAQKHLQEYETWNTYQHELNKQWALSQMTLLKNMQEKLFKSVPNRRHHMVIQVGKDFRNDFRSYDFSEIEFSEVAVSRFLPLRVLSRSMWKGWKSFPHDTRGTDAQTELPSPLVVQSIGTG